MRTSSIRLPAGATWVPFDGTLRARHTPLRGARGRSWARGVVALGALAVGCSDLFEDEGDASCSLSERRQNVLDVMQQHYLWNDALPEVEPKAFATPGELMAALRYREGDALIDRWSRVEVATERDAFYGAGEVVGFGFVLVASGDGEPEAVHLGLVFSGSPAADAGLQRGDRIVALAGVPIERVLAEGLWDELDGEDEPGVTVELTVSSSSAPEPRAVTLTKAVFAMDTVSPARVLVAGERRVGYLGVTSFIEPTEDELRAEFATLKSEDVDELIVDLRYNGGGLLSGARELASLAVAGDAALDGAPLALLERNAQNRGEGEEAIRLASDAGSLALARVVVITGARTASASELFINGLEPHVEVLTVGETTYGKPVGGSSWVACGDAISPITFRIKNAAGVGDYFQGLEPDCAVADDLEHELGDPREARLAAALTLVSGSPDTAGVCAPAPRVERLILDRPGALRPAPRLRPH